MEARVDAGGRRGLWLVLAVAVLLRLPFLNQAIQGDDHIYITEGAHALIEPLHPGHTKYVFGGREVDLRGHSHPGTFAWFLAPLIAAFGGVREVPFHAAFVVFTLIAAVSMWSLARRFSPRPVWAALLFLAVPAFVVNGNSLESDVPFVAFWMAAIALFCADRLALAAAAMVLAALTAYQAVLLTPVLAVWVWQRRRQAAAAWLAILTPVLWIAAWQIFERAATGAMPAAVLSGYFTIYQTLAAKMRNAAMLTIHAWFIVFPLLLAPALALAWRKRRERDTAFLLAWIAIFFAGALAIFFAGSARYLLPMAAPVALMASRLRTRWLAAGFAAQMALGLLLAAANYQHWGAYRRFAQRPLTVGAHNRLYVDDEWGLRHYMEERGAAPLMRTTVLRAGDVVVSGKLGRSVEITSPATELASAVVRPSVPLRLIGLESGSGYSDVSRGFWPFGISSGVVDRIRAVQIGERHPALEYVSFDPPSPGLAEHVVSGVYPNDHWMAKSAVLALKSPAVALPVRVWFYVADNAPARRMTVLLDGREIAAQTVAGPGVHTVSSSPARPAGATAMIELDVDRTFNAPGDNRELGVVLLGAGFER